MQNREVNPIRELREKLFLERKDLAEILGITTTAVALYEHGKRTPRMSILKKIKELHDENKIDFNINDYMRD